MIYIQSRVVVGVAEMCAECLYMYTSVASAVWRGIATVALSVATVEWRSAEHKWKEGRSMTQRNWGRLWAVSKLTCTLFILLSFLLVQRLRLCYSLSLALRTIPLSIPPLSLINNQRSSEVPVSMKKDVSLLWSLPTCICIYIHTYTHIFIYIHIHLYLYTVHINI